MSDAGMAPAVGGQGDAASSAPVSATTSAPVSHGMGTASPSPLANQVSNAAPVSQPATAEWTASFNDDLKGYVHNKGFKDPGAVLESYRNLEKLIGAPKERIVKLPEKADDPAWAEVYDRLGRPKDAKEYTIKAPEGLGEDKQFVDWAKGKFHELGLTRQQGEKLSQSWNEYVATQMNGASEANQQASKEAEQALKKEWGAAFEQNLNVVDRAAKQFGLEDKHLLALRQALGPAEAAKLVLKIGQGIGEDTFVAGETRASSFGALTPAQAVNRIGALRQDPDFVRRYTGGDSNAKAEMERLHSMAYPQ